MHLIFDLDGTLVYSLPGITKSLNLSLAENGLPQHPEALVRSFIGDGVWMLCRRAAPKAKKSMIDTLEECFKAHYARLWRTGTKVYDGIIALLSDIPAHHHLSVLSNKPHDFTTEIVHALFPEGCFDLVLGQRGGIAKKPDPAGVHEIIACSHHHDQNAILIGDSTVDLQTSHNAGIGSIAVTWGFEDLGGLKACSPDHIVSTIEDLTRIIQSL